MMVILGTIVSWIVVLGAMAVGLILAVEIVDWVYPDNEEPSQGNNERRDT